MDIIKQMMTFGGATCDDQGDHSVFWVSVEHFNKLPITQWAGNREPDKGRVAEIREWMDKSKRMDGIIYLAHENNHLVCYESGHRREALKGLEGMHLILVDVLWNADGDKIKQEFNRLNKAISVPDIYTNNHSSEFVNGIKELVNQFCERYKSLRSNTGRPHRPNFNRDLLTSEFTRVMEEKKIDIVSLRERLETLNSEMSQRDKTGLSPKVIQKCEESGLWLFAWSSKLDV
jgi:hypothetical protein